MKKKKPNEGEAAFFLATFFSVNLLTLFVSVMILLVKLYSG